MTAMQFSNEYYALSTSHTCASKPASMDNSNWTFLAVKEQSFKNYLTTKVVKVLFSSRKTHSLSGETSIFTSVI